MVFRACFFSLGFRVPGLGLLEFKVFRVEGLGFRV